MKTYSITDRLRGRFGFILCFIFFAGHCPAADPVAGEAARDGRSPAGVNILGGAAVKAGAEEDLDPVDAGGGTGPETGGEGIVRRKLSPFFSERSGLDPAPSFYLGDLVQTVDSGLDILLTAGSAYDSNTQLAPADAAVGAWVSWVNVGLAGNFGANQDQGLFYGFNLNGSIFGYGTAEADGGRDNVEPIVNLFAGIRGAKTTFRVDTGYRLNNGNTVDLSERQRESRRADSNDFDFTVSANRTLPHGSLMGAVTFDQRDFDARTGLNDQVGIIWDGAWMFNPGFTPKTSYGLGVRAASFDTDANFDQSFIEPSIRFEHRYSPKTRLFSRVGYDIRDANGAGAVAPSGLFAFEAGAAWQATPKTNLTISGYRDYSPSVASAFENFNNTGMIGSVSHNLPWWALIARFDLSYDQADYFSTLQGASATREDDYVRYGVTLSKPLRLSKMLNGEAAAFYYRNSNNSTTLPAEFDQNFAGVRVGVTY